MTYPFFVSTLPMLQQDAPPPMTVERFQALAQRYLTATDFAVLEALETGSPSPHPFVRAWIRHETQLRNAVARHRASRLGQDVSPWLREHEGYDVSLERGVAAAFQESNPLRRERALEALRWRKAGELAGFDPFSIEAVLVYSLQLRLCEGASARDEAKGRRRREAVLSATPLSETEPPVAES